jgi:hypothetical protein
MSDISDDAFISFRFAKHLAEGKGLVFNEGERVEGYTNFLWVMLMAAGYKAGFQLPHFSQAISILCAALLVMSVALFSQSYFSGLRFRFVSYIAPACLALNPLFWEHIGTGLETVMFALLLFLGIVAYVNHGRRAGMPYLTGILLGLAYLTRPEAVLWVGVCIGIDALAAAFDRKDLSQRMRITVAYACVFGLIAGAHFLWRVGYYGDWLPNTYYVKGTSNWVWGKIHTMHFLRSTGFLPVIAVCGGLFVLRTKWAVCMSVLISVFLLYNFRIGGDIIMTGRFLFPLLPLMFLLIQELVRLAFAGSLDAQESNRLNRMMAWCFQISVVILFLSGIIRESKVARKEVDDSRSANSFARFCAQCIRKHTRPDDTIAVVSAGIIPYYSERKTIDMLGLNDRHIARHGILDTGCFIGHQKTDSEYILDRGPRIIVLPPEHAFKKLVAAEKHMLENPRFGELYESAVLNCGGYPLNLFVRKDYPLDR